MGGHSHYSDPTGPVGPAPQEHNVVYTTLHFDKPWSYENYLKTGGYAALRKVLTEKVPQFRLLASGNQRPETTAVSPLYQIKGIADLRLPIAD